MILLSLLIFQQPVKSQETPDDDAPIKVDTLLFTIPLTVSDNAGRNIPGLKRENFSVIQDGEKQQIEFFLDESSPMHVAILVDTSFSTKPVLDNIQKAARDFLKVLRPEDKAIVVSFDYRTFFLSDLTSDSRKLSKAIDGAAIADRSGSDMNEAITQIVNNYFARVKGRKAIIVLTDGMVEKRRISFQETLETMQKADTVFYPIIFRTKFYTDARLRNPGGRKPLPVELLHFLANETAGRVYEREATDLKTAFSSISEEMKKQYLIGYYPQNIRKSSVVRVLVDRKNAFVQAKKSIFLD